MAVKRINVNVSLTPELETYLNKRVDSGDYQTVSEVVREAIRLQRDRDTAREEHLEQLRRGIENAYQEALKGGASSGNEVRARLRKSRAKHLQEQKTAAIA